jgi:hypothetical protein
MKMDITINSNPDKRNKFVDGTEIGYYSIVIDGTSRGHLWLSDKELEILRIKYNIGIVNYD